MGRESGNKGRFSRVEKAGLNAVRHILAEKLGWSPEVVENDFGVDLRAEICDSSENPTGRLLGFQVKSGLSYFKEKRGENIVFRFSPAHYAYWLSCSFPIVIVLYNTTSHTAIWAHVTPENCTKTGRRWKLLVPISQELSSASATELGRIAAPQTLPVLIQREEKRLGDFDPRFDVTVRATASGLAIGLSAKENAHIDLSMKAELDIMLRVKQAFESGKTVELDTNDISFEGSDLLTELQKAGPGRVVLRPGIRRSCLVGLVANGVAGSVAIPMMRGTLTAGSKKYCLVSSLDGTPLSLECESCPETKTVSIAIKYEVPALKGKHLLQLKHFEEMRQFFAAIAAGEPVSLSVMAEGFPPVNINLKQPVQDSGRLQDVFSRLADAQLVAQALGINPSIPALTEGDLADIKEAKALVTHGQYDLTVESSTFDCNLPTQSLTPFITPGYKSLFIANPDMSIRFLRKSYRIGQAAVLMDQATISNLKAIETAIRDGRRVAKIKFAARKSSQIHFFAKKYLKEIPKSLPPF